jgi:hypothetical protein
MKAKVISEHYMVGEMKFDHFCAEIGKEAFRQAAITGNSKICRITVFELDRSKTEVNEFDVMLPWFTVLSDDGTKIVGEICTGSTSYSAPDITDINLSRYHPNNGWSIPEEITL